MQRSFSYLLLITWILVSFSCKTQFVQKSYETKNISVSEKASAVDNQVVELYQPFKEILEKDMNRVISYSKVELSKDKPESLLTNFLGDLLLKRGKEFAKENGNVIEPVISYLNYGGIRTYLPEGDITVRNIYELMPFENEMVFILLTGRQVQEFYDIVASKGGDCIGGAKLIISNGKAKNILIGDKNLNPDSDYWVVTNDYVAEGGDELEVFTKRSEYVKSGEKIRDIIISHLEEIKAKNKNVNVGLDGRIKYE